MRLRHVYLALCVIGVVAPYAELIPWLAQHGLQLGLLVRELFATRIGAFFGLDVVVSAIVLFVFVFRRACSARYSPPVAAYRGDARRGCFVRFTLIPLYARASPRCHETHLTKRCSEPLAVVLKSSRMIYEG